MTFSLDWLARKLSGAARLCLPALELQASLAMPGFSLGPQTHTILFPEPALIPLSPVPSFTNGFVILSLLQNWLSIQYTVNLIKPRVFVSNNKEWLMFVKPTNISEIRIACSVFSLKI